ncbi:MAG: hypothetical protein PHV20_12680 [Bacteroidales bacterium]|nr:hypothetical protein [Bacteroidales bacterium]
MNESIQSIFTIISDDLKDFNKLSSDLKNLEEFDSKLIDLKSKAVDLINHIDLYLIERAEADVRIEDQKNPTIIQTEVRVLVSKKVGDVIAKRLSVDLSQAFSINDKFRFQKELFGGSAQEMNRVLNFFQNETNMEAILTYIKNDLQWDLESQSVVDFIEIVEKRY